MRDPQRLEDGLQELKKVTRRHKDDRVRTQSLLRRTRVRILLLAGAVKMISLVLIVVCPAWLLSDSATVEPMVLTGIFGLVGLRLSREIRRTLE